MHQAIALIFKLRYSLTKNEGIENQKAYITLTLILLVVTDYLAINNNKKRAMGLEPTTFTMGR